jgi:hypothetical protein
MVELDALLHAGFQIKELSLSLVKKQGRLD